VFTDAPSSETSVEADAENLLRKSGMTWFMIIPATTKDRVLRQGPHILVGGRFFEAWRVYKDHRGAFVTTVYPEGQSVLRPLRTACH